MSDLVKSSGGQPAKKSATSPAKKAPVKKAAVKKAAVKKAAAKKAPAKKAAAKKAPAKKTHAKKGSAKKAPTTKTSSENGPSMARPALPAPPSDPLAVLGMVAPYTPAQLRRAWRTFAARHHPDQGGDAVTFDRGRQAFETLRRGAS